MKNEFTYTETVHAERCPLNAEHDNPELVALVSSFLDDWNALDDFNIAPGDWFVVYGVERYSDPDWEVVSDEEFREKFTPVGDRYSGWEASRPDEGTELRDDHELNSMGLPRAEPLPEPVC